MNIQGCMKIRQKLCKNLLQSKIFSLNFFRLLFIIISANIVSLAHAGTLEQAKQLHDRLTGVSASQSMLLEMVA